MALFLPFLSLLLHLFAVKLCIRHSLTVIFVQSSQAETATGAQAHSTENLQFECCPHNKGHQWNCIVSAIVYVTLRDGIYHEDVGYAVADNVPFIKSQSNNKLHHCQSLITRKPTAPDNSRREPQQAYIPLWPHWPQPHVATLCDHAQPNKVLQQWQHHQMAPKHLIVDPTCSQPDNNLYDTDDNGPIIAAFAMMTTHDGTPPQFDKTPLCEDGSSSSKSHGEPQLDCITPHALQRRNHTSTAIPHSQAVLTATTQPPIHSQMHVQMPPHHVAISQCPMPPRPPGAAQGSTPPSTAPVDLSKTAPPIIREPHAKCACSLSLVQPTPTTTHMQAVSHVDTELEKRISRLLKIIIHTTTETLIVVNCQLRQGYSTSSVKLLDYDPDHADHSPQFLDYNGLI
ncbi:hypothetical protein K439DRAFT_1509237 [Ramaria rubella]|nr:hypothetical protein K439DRAFT_1509237 [Ramaria rubella]